MAFSRVSAFRQISIPSLHTFSKSPLTIPGPVTRSFNVSACLSTEETTSPQPLDSVVRTTRRKPICLYYTQGKCTKMDDPTHLEIFNHSCSVEVKRNAVELERMRPQQLDFFLVLDLEGKVEILEFPVLMVDAKTMDVVGFFHRFVRPSQMSEQRINEYIEGKYGKIGVDRVWHDTAIPFNEVIHQFEDWMAQYHLWEKDRDERLKKAAFVTCGNWDLKTKVPQQCKVARMKLPPYFMEWINLKDAYLNFYQRRATGMVTMMRELQIPLIGSHHLGIDDTKNITRVLHRMLIDGAVLQITAKRDPKSPEAVEFLFKNRIRYWHSPLEKFSKIWGRKVQKGK